MEKNTDHILIKAIRKEPIEIQISKNNIDKIREKHGDMTIFMNNKSAFGSPTPKTNFVRTSPNWHL